MKWARDTVYVERDPWPDAACRGKTSMMLVPVTKRGSSVQARARIARAKNLCANCPVLDECRVWALTTPDPVIGMVAGGLTPNDRKRVRRLV